MAIDEIHSVPPKTQQDNQRILEKITEKLNEIIRELNTLLP